MNRTLSWLHISDIHFTAKTEWRDRSSRDSLISYLNTLFSSRAAPYPDLIFCTGDIAFGETSAEPLKEQYKSAEEFFDKLLIACGNGKPLPRDRLFVVPGNHDINRKSINSDAQSSLISWSKESAGRIGLINARFSEKTKELLDAMERLNEYSEFVKYYLPHQFDENGRCTYTRTVPINGITISISGFNSAWSCSGAEDDRNIWLAGAWQFNESEINSKEAELRIGLIHHPVDWLTLAERDIATKRISSDFDFWLHGHCHSAWVTPTTNAITIAAGAVGAETSDEFGVNVTTLDLTTKSGSTSLYSKRSSEAGWTICPIATHAPLGVWNYPLNELQAQVVLTQNQAIDGAVDFKLRYFKRRLDEALQSFSSQPSVWVSPILSTASEIAKDARQANKVAVEDICKSPRNAFIKAPPQYGLTCLAHHMIMRAWEIHKNNWIYLDAKSLKPHRASIEDAIKAELDLLAISRDEIDCIILDSWNTEDKDSIKLINNIIANIGEIPLICMQQIDGGNFTQDMVSTEKPHEIYYLWALSRTCLREMVSAYNETRPIGDDDAVTNRLVADFEALNLHRTPLNCLTLLKVSEIDFDESPVNRSEVIRRVLLLLFSSEELPTYKTKPDLKDCEYVLGYFCEILIREEIRLFARDKFLLEIKKCCQERFIDLETNLVFDVLYKNNIIVKRGNLFTFKFRYWVLYFAAQRMHQSKEFAEYILSDMRYINYPEIIEFYTGADRRRDDALVTLIDDLKSSYETVANKCGLQLDMNPYQRATWEPSEEAEAQMRKAISEGIRDSNLPAALKDQYADQTYDQTRPYNQEIGVILREFSVICMLQAMSAAARALRNSDYASPSLKKDLLKEIINCWEYASRVLFIILPILAKEGYASYHGIGFTLGGGFSSGMQERFVEILSVIPANVVGWSQDDVYSKKMAPLFYDKLDDHTIGEIGKHELILLIIEKRPRDWEKQIQKYIATLAKNSFYLLDVYKALRAQYRYSFASGSTLKDIEYLIKLVAAKHVTGARLPSEKTMSKVTFSEDVIPKRDEITMSEKMPASSDPTGPT